MNKLDVHFSSVKDDWETPDWLFEKLDADWGFALDVCANSKNAKCRRYYNKKANGLVQPWDAVWWCNPPYGREVKHWVREGAFAEVPGVMLLPARTDTRWFHDYIWDVEKGQPRKNTKVWFLKGRLKFKGAKHSAPFPSMVVIFD